ncbi:MAG: hypothetical protein KDD12_07485 [Lewinella sp.]|nr:hypothetical protein [Lewinella sp.]
MKTVSDDLFQLIHSLSGQEKRYFKLYAGRHVIGEQNKYVLLFDAIAAQPVYQEPAIRQQFAGEPFIRQLHVAKHYLYKLIMDSLRLYHENQSGDQFRRNLRNAQLLFEKGLYRQGEKSLAKARKWAEEREEFLQVLEVCRWEHQIAHRRNDHAWIENYLSNGLYEEFDVLNKYRNFLEFQALNDQVFTPYWQKGAIRSEEEKAALKRLFDRPLFQSADHARSFFARYFYLNARFSYFLFLGEPENAYPHIVALVDMFAGLPESRLKGRRIRNFISALINLYVVQRQLGKYGEIPATLERLREAPAESPDQGRRLQVRRLNLETDFYLTAGKFGDGVKRISRYFEAEVIAREETNSQQRLGLYYNLAYLYFGAGDYGKALDWVNLLLNDPDLKIRADIHGFGRLLNLIIHYELGNDQLLEYIVQATSRFLSSRSRLFKVEAVMLKFMRRYPRWLTRADRRKGFNALLAELEKLRDDEFERKAFDYFNFIAWMKSKAEERPFSEVVLDEE